MNKNLLLALIGTVAAASSAFGQRRFSHSRVRASRSGEIDPKAVEKRERRKARNLRIAHAGGYGPTPFVNGQ